LNLAIGLLIKKEAYGYTGLLETVQRLLEDNWEEEQAFQKWREEKKRKEEEEEEGGKKRRKGKGGKRRRGGKRRGRKEEVLS